MSKDTIADIITSIRNLTWMKKEQFEYHLLTSLKILLKSFYEKVLLKTWENIRKAVIFFLVLTLRHRRNRKGPYRTVLNLKRISRPGLRIYSNYQRIPRILGGMGIVILSTSRGIMTDREARIEGIGGEILCYIW